MVADVFYDVFYAVLRRDRVVVIGGLAGVIAVSWAYLLLGAGIEMEMPEMGGRVMMAPAWTPGYAALIFAMWAVMMVAMMLPSAAPAILLVATIARRRAAGGTADVSARIPATAALFALGYLIVWTGFGLAATLLQWGLDGAGLLSQAMASRSTILAGVALTGAGIYQWTPLKQSCLSQCRSPLDFLMNHWREGPGRAVSSGLRHGLFCLGCCWMLMTLLFVGGLMNLWWVGAIALLVLVEKTLPWGRRMGRLLGVLLTACGALLLATAV